MICKGLRCLQINEFLNNLKLKGKVVSIILADEPVPTEAKKAFCTLSLLNYAFNGETLCFSITSKGCPGAARGMGFFDGIPQVKGGFGNFIANGCGDGYPEGERIKQSPEIAEKMLCEQPEDVLDSKQYIIIKPYELSDNAACVTFLCNCDQLSLLVHLYAYRQSSYDSVIAPMCSGCASIFRIPLGERKKENPRAVIGNIDIFSRIHFSKDTFFFTVSGQTFKQMLDDANQSFLTADKWKDVRERII